MKQGELVQLPHALAPRWMYKGIPAYGQSTITVATDWRWGHGMVGIVIDITNAPGVLSPGLMYLQVLTPAGQVGWIPDSWAEVIDGAG